MTPRHSTPVSTNATAEFDLLAKSFERSLRAENLSPRTIQTYGEATNGLRRFLVERDMPTAPHVLAREHIESYIAYLLENWKPATAAKRFRALRRCFGYLEDEGEIDQTPMRKMKPPRVPVEPVPVLDESAIKKLLKTCDGKEFTDRRDRALILLMLDTGARRAEIANLTLEDVDLDANVIIVVGKGRRTRAVPFGRKTALALDRYIRSRLKHRDNHRPELWLGHSGPMKANGINQVISKRTEQAGLPHIKPHQFRHGFASAWLENGGNESDLMRLTGWQSRDMLSRYAAATADRCAHDSYRTRGGSIVDRL